MSSKILPGPARGIALIGRARKSDYQVKIFLGFPAGSASDGVARRVLPSRVLPN